MSKERPMGILQKSSDLVQLLAEEGPLSPAEIAQQVGMPRSSVYRLTDALAQAGLTELLRDSRVRVSLRWLRLADAARASMTEWHRARAVLDELAAKTGQTVFLSVPRAEETVCIDWAQGEANVVILKPSKSLPLNAGAAGRVTLAFGVDSPDRYLAKAPFPAYTKKTLVTAAELKADIATSRRQGYTISDQDVAEGIGGLGAPIRLTSTDGFAGALSLAGLADEFTDRRAEFVQELLAAANRLSSSAP
jgi:IclR family acetate operon transcriptional repressor